MKGQGADTQSERHPYGDISGIVTLTNDRLAIIKKGKR